MFLTSVSGYPEIPVILKGPGDGLDLLPDLVYNGIATKPFLKTPSSNLIKLSPVHWLNKYYH